jgi:hypothetical protein
MKKIAMYFKFAIIYMLVIICIDIFVIPQIRNPTKVSERCGPNRQECDFSSLD